MDQKLKSKLTSILPLILILIIFGISITHKINLVNSDLGRHLKNGELFFQNFSPIITNFYSYTEPNYPVVTHHWLSGVILYLFYKITGFTGLSVFYSLLNLLTFYIFLKIAQKKVGLNLSSLIALPMIPLLCERPEVRPEIFSYLFCGVFSFLLLRFKEKKLSFFWLLTLPILEILWVNLHIYFFLGLVLIGLFWLESLLNVKKQSQQFNNSCPERSRRITIVFIFSIMAVFINPFGIKGVLTPLTIFNNYGYRIIENQPVWFIEKLIPNPNYLTFKIIFSFLILSFFFVPKKNFSVINFFLAIFFSLMAWLQLRNFALFGFFALMIIATNLENFFQIHVNFSKILSFLSQGVIIFIFLLVISGNLNLSPSQRKSGFGLAEADNQSAEFFKREKISGPIFNNYDIGSYLIFHLFPSERVFVDNRPEAYSNDFFQKVYIPMQEEEKIWQQIDRKFNFNVIYFYRHDATPWGQQFLVSKVKDPNWAVVYFDDFAIIYLKRTKNNQKIIDKYEIPREYFKVN